MMNKEEIFIELNYFRSTNLQDKTGNFKVDNLKNLSEWIPDDYKHHFAIVKNEMLVGFFHERFLLLPLLQPQLWYSGQRGARHHASQLFKIFLIIKLD